MSSSQVTIRASLSGRSPAQPDSPKQCITVKPECFTKQSKSKSDVAAKRTKTALAGKKLRRPNIKHNLALSNLRLNTDTFPFKVTDATSFSLSNSSPTPK